jgi:hypothetical protein
VCSTQSTRTEKNTLGTQLRVLFFAVILHRRPVCAVVETRCTPSARIISQVHGCMLIPVNQVFTVCLTGEHHCGMVGVEEANLILTPLASFDTQATRIESLLRVLSLPTTLRVTAMTSAHLLMAQHRQKHVKWNVRNGSRSTWIVIQEKKSTRGWSMSS